MTTAEPVARGARSAADAGSWAGRPRGVPASVPPPSLPLSFLAAAALGLVACGGAWVWAARAAAVDPTADHVVAAAHFGVLATLSMGVLGALHQFIPVVTQRSLRSIRLARLTFVTWLGAAWLLPIGVAAGRESVVEAGGALAGVAVTSFAVNVWPPLLARGKGAPVTGLRFAVIGFIATACFGLLYVADRRGNWFDLSGHVVLAHATVGLFAWLGLSYVAVAEKLWPMFFLAHVPGRRRAGRLAVAAVPGGVCLLSPGLLTGVAPLAWAGGTLLAVGLGAHLVSLAAHVRHRRRRPDLHLLFVSTSGAWLVVGAALALAASLVVPGDPHAGTALVAGAVAALGGWLLETLVGHTYKVVPFIAWAALRSRGVDRNGAGRPLMFSDLYNHTWAAATYGSVTAGIACLTVGLSGSVPPLTGAGGVLLTVTALIAASNLSLGPVRMLPAAGRYGRPTEHDERGDS